MIIRTRNRGEVERRSFSLSDMTRYGYTGLRSSSAYGESSVRGIPALFRAARIRSEALASLRLKCWRGEGVDREEVTSVWQARLFRDRPNPEQTRFGFWEAVGESLAWRNKAFVFKLTDPMTSRVLELYALHPDQVSLKSDGYEVTVTDGYIDPVGRGPGKYRVDDSTMLFIRGHGQGGMRDVPTPIEVFRDALESPVLRQRHESRMWRRGTALQVAVQFPQGVTAVQADEWRDRWRASYEGTEGETTAVIGGGAEIKPIGMTLTDAAYVQMANLTVNDAARIMGVNANLLGAATAEGVIPNLEQDLQNWLRFGLGPELERIESAFQGDEQIFGAAPPNAASVYPGFDTDHFVRGDLKTEAAIVVADVQAGLLTPDEGRAIKGYPPLPDGAGAIPQITPVGGAPNPVPVVAGNGSQNGATTD